MSQSNRDCRNTVFILSPLRFVKVWVKFLITIRVSFGVCHFFLFVFSLFSTSLSSHHPQPIYYTSFFASSLIFPLFFFPLIALTLSLSVFLFSLQFPFFIIAFLHLSASLHTISVTLSLLYIVLIHLTYLFGIVHWVVYEVPLRVTSREIVQKHSICNFFALDFMPKFTHFVFTLNSSVHLLDL